MKDLLKKTIYYFFLALAFVTPLVYSSQTVELYEFPKMFFVYFLGTTIIFLYLVYAVIGGRKEFIRPNYWVLGYLAAICLSVIFSSHLYTSLWGYYSRFNGGLISYLIFFALYLVGINFLEQRDRETLKDVFCLGLLPVSLYGLFQISESPRIFSTLGQPNWLAAYIVFLLPLLLERTISAENLLKKSFWIFTFIISLVCLWFTGSLSGMLGFGAAALFLLWHFRKKVLNKWGLAALVLFLLLSAANFRFFSERISDALVLSTNPQDYQVSDPGLIRLGLWQGSLKMAISSPKTFLVGTGPETFPYQFPFFRKDFLNYSSEWDFILNKPHNFYLEILVESGIFSLLFYLGIVAYTLRQKNFYLGAGLLAFYVSNFFSWPTVTTSLIFWFWLIFLAKKKDPSI